MTSPARRAFDLAVDALATYRLARLIVDEDSPASRAARDAFTAATPESWHGAPECTHCMGLWVALGVGVARLIPGWRYIAAPLAVAGAQSLLVSATGIADGDGAPTEHQGPVPPPSRPLTGPILTDEERAEGRVKNAGGWGRALDPDELAAGRRARSALGDLGASIAASANRPTSPYSDVDTAARLRARGLTGH